MAKTVGLIDGVGTAADVVLSIGAALLVMMTVLLLPLAIRRTWRQSRRTQVIIDNLLDGTGDLPASGLVLGLTYRLRDEVIEAFATVVDRAQQTLERGAADWMSPINAVPLGDVDHRALLEDVASSHNDLMESLEGAGAEAVREEDGLFQSIDVMVPDAGRGLYRLLATTLLRPRVMRVEGLILRVSDASGGMALSFTVRHIGPEHITRRVTISEDQDCGVEKKTTVERFHELVVPAARCLACELFRQRLMVTMSDRGRLRRRSLTAKRLLVELLVGCLYQDGALGSAPATASFYKLVVRR